MMLQGLKVIESTMLEQDGEPYLERRPWRERLLRRPWRPWVATRTVVPRVPYKGYCLIGSTMLVHPVTLKQMMEGLKQ